MEKGRLFWVTGLSASGKTTVSRLVVNNLQSIGHQILLLDGDDLRAVLNENSSHSRADRLRIGFTYSRLCKLLVEQGLDVLIATVALFSEIHDWNRKNISNYLEIFIDVPIEELVRRDPKGIYKKFYDGEIQNVAGLDMQVDFPLNPDLHIKYKDGLTAHQIAKQVSSLITNT